MFVIACESGSGDSNSTDPVSTISTSVGGDGDGDGTGGNPINRVCDPSTPVECELAEGICCSDDPAAVLLSDLDAMVIPLYDNRDGLGTPMFSGSNNSLSRWGLCVGPSSIPTDNRLIDPGAIGCPVPCNPEWSASDVATICDGDRICCQSLELESEDCGLDPALGDGGCWRPVTGADIIGLGGIDASNWASTSHATHQDPNGDGCQAFASDNLQLLACFERLTVANRRGFCTEATSCPYAGPDYVDACEQLNLDEGRTGC
jgi:hypothetical protein